MGRVEEEAVTAIGPVLFLERGAIDMRCIAAATLASNNELEILFNGSLEPTLVCLPFSVFMREYKKWCKQQWEPEIVVPASAVAMGLTYAEYAEQVNKADEMLQDWMNEG